MLESSSGGKEKAKTKKCSNCDGRGWNQSLRQVGPGLVTNENVPCGNCRSTGQVFRDKDRCRKCKGECLTEEKKVLEVYIPRGSKEGDKIVLEGEADEQPGFETGDIVFILEEKEHEVFTRVGSDLMATLKVDLVESLTGFTRVVLKHLDGRAIQLTHPVGEILKPGQTLKLPGEGMPHKKGDGKGDLYLNVQIVFPESGWKPEVAAIRKVLPAAKPEVIIGDPIDELDYVRDASPEEVSTHPAAHEMHANSITVWRRRRIVGGRRGRGRGRWASVCAAVVDWRTLAFELLRIFPLLMGISLRASCSRSEMFGGGGVGYSSGVGLAYLFHSSRKVDGFDFICCGREPWCNCELFLLSRESALFPGPRHYFRGTLCSTSLPTRVHILHARLSLSLFLPHSRVDLPPPPARARWKLPSPIEKRPSRLYQ